MFRSDYDVSSRFVSHTDVNVRPVLCINMFRRAKNNITVYTIIIFQAHCTMRDRTPVAGDATAVSAARAGTTVQRTWLDFNYRGYTA
jgi:hypothetical protein